MRLLLACGILSQLVGCSSAAHDGMTGNALVDACLHWTACVTPPPSVPGIDFPQCASAGSAFTTLPWRRGISIGVSPAESACLAAAGLDCAAALACVSTPATCDKPTWSCDGDTLTFCDAFSGPRAVVDDCAARGLHCVMLGGEQAFCGLGSCDVTTTPAGCDGNIPTSCQPQTSWDDKSLGGLVVTSEDCADVDATCSAGGCVGNGPACTPSPDTIGCDGDDVLRCDDSGHQERLHCTPGSHCGTTTGPGFTYGCVSDTTNRQVVCELDANFEQCHGDSLEYCDDDGNQTLDCKSLGYAGCDSGHCVPR